jgi:hypothetical protein
VASIGRDHLGFDWNTVVDAFPEWRKHGGVGFVLLGTDLYAVGKAGRLQRFEKPSDDMLTVGAMSSQSLDAIINGLIHG